MKTLMITIAIFACSFAYSQYTLDLAVDSSHRVRILSAGIPRTQSWEVAKTRSQDNILAASKLSGAVEIDLDSVAMPFDGYMTSRYGKRWNEWHPGVDVALRVGDSVRAAWDGVVRYAMMNRGGYGNLVIVRHRNGLETYYAHMSRILVSSGQFVCAGQVLGLGGNTGRSFGPHLHFEVRFYDVSLDPELLVDFRQKKVVSGSLALTSDLLKGRVQIPTGVLSDEFESIEFVAGVALPMSGRYESKVPANMRRYHYVRKGDCLEKIASTYRTSVHDLCRLNHIDQLKWLFVGQRIRVN